jgi:hypothetical protein
VGNLSGRTVCILGIVMAAVAVAGCASASARQNPISHAIGPVTKPAVPSTMSTPAPLFQRAALDCTSNTLGAEFRGGGYGGGNDFGGIWIWNTTSQPCTLHGSVAFAAYLPDGFRDPAAETNGTVSFRPTTLPPNMTAPPDNADPSDYIFAGLMGSERDDPTQPNGLCRPQDEQTPATLALSLGTASLEVRNYAAGSPVKAIYGCHGRVLLEGVTGPLTG